MIKIDGNTRLCGLIGNPVEHTMSPAIHNTLAEQLGHNLVYIPFLVEPELLVHAVKGAYALNMLGCNVTIPYKSAVMPYLAETDRLAEQIGAVNTLVRAEGGFKGYNTDMTGLLRAMKAEKIELEGEHVIILGAGGAARAVAYLCAANGAEQIYLMNRTRSTAEAVAAEINASFGVECVLPMALEEYRLLPERKYLAVQGTSVGLHPHAEEAVITDPDFYARIHTGYDLIYRPAKTKFMSSVEDAGGKAYNGLKMLLYQGVNAYELWNQVTVSEEMTVTAYKEMKKTLGIAEE